MTTESGGRDEGSRGEAGGFIADMLLLVQNGIERLAEIESREETRVSVTNIGTQNSERGHED